MITNRTKELIQIIREGTTAANDESYRLSSAFQGVTQKEKEALWGNNTTLNEDTLLHLDLNPYIQSLRQRALDALSSDTSKALNLMINALDKLKEQAPNLVQNLFTDFMTELQKRDFSDIANILSHNYTPQDDRINQANILA